MNVSTAPPFPPSQREVIKLIEDAKARQASRVDPNDNFRPTEDVLSSRDKDNHFEESDKPLPYGGDDLKGSKHIDNNALNEMQGETMMGQKIDTITHQ